MTIEGYKLLKHITGVRCARCEQFIWSRHRHDYRACNCGYTTIDGGREYLKYGAGVADDSELKMPTVETYDILVKNNPYREVLLPPSKKAEEDE